MPPSVNKFTSGIRSRGREPDVPRAYVRQFLQMNILKGRDDTQKNTENVTESSHGEATQRLTVFQLELKSITRLDFSTL